MDKKYNGFNNGRDKSDGVGGREVNNGTQETMTKEQILGNYYREHTDTETAIYEAMEHYAQQQLSAERESHKKEIERILSAVARGENLADSLNFDGKSELDKERERAGKLVEALNIAIGVFDLTGYEKTSKILKEYIKEYQSKNQDHTKPSS